MNCLHPDLLNRYLDGTLSPRERESLEKHLPECDSCLEEYAMAKIIIKDVGEEALLPGPKEVIMNALAEINRKVGKFIQWMGDLQAPEWMLTQGASPVRSGRKEPSLSSVFVRREMEGLHTEIFMTKNDDNKISMYIKVFDGNEAVRNIMLILIRDNDMPMARFMRRDSECFDKLRYGSYRLILEKNAMEKGKYIFRIDDRGFYEN